MSKIERFHYIPLDDGGMDPDTDGEYVLYSDHERIVAELEATIIELRGAIGAGRVLLGATAEMGAASYEQLSNELRLARVEIDHYQTTIGDLD